MREAMDNELSAVLCSVVQDVSQAVDRNISGAQLLHELLSAPWLHALLQVYECLLQFQRARPSPVLPFASGLSAEVLASIQEAAPHFSVEAQELYSLLSSPDLQALLWCHDSVAQVDYGPVLPEQQAWDGQQALRLVCLEKREEPLVRQRPLYLAGGVSPNVADPGQSRRSSNDYATPPPPVPATTSPLLFRRGGAPGRCRNIPTPGRIVTPHRALTAPSSPATCRSTRHQSGTAPVTTTNLYPPSQQGMTEDDRALKLLAEVVDKLQGLVASRTPQAPPSSRLHPPHLGASSRSSSICSSSSYSSSTSSLSSGAAPRSVVQMNRGCSAAPCRPGVDGQGATIKRDEETGGIFIARVINGGLADRSGLLHPGDELVEVNGNPVGGLEPEHVIHILLQSQGTILFKVAPDSTHTSSSLKPVFMRAMLDYCPLLDTSSPCPQAGVAFRRGDLLQVVDCSDPQWWQARKLPDITSCAGLIPSASRLKSKLREQWWSQPLQVHTCVRPLAADHEGEGRAAEDRPLQTGAEHNDITEGRYSEGEKRSLRLWRRRSCTSCPSCSTALCPVPYEEVELYQRSPQENHRLILLTSIQGVGVNNLKKRLFSLHPARFQGPVSHTTRPIRGGEQPGKEFYFVSRQQFEHMACSRRLVEHGEREGHLYGTSMDAILEVIHRGMTCIMDVEPHNIQLLRTSSLKPFVIFIRAPGPEWLRTARKDEEHLAQLEEASQLVEARYRHFFDRLVVHQEEQEATEELTSIIQEAQEKAQWCPISWRPSNQ